mmetsp:Transcript_67515/g.166794  ORF Transcript_67515/g.166794 Transcript_67515/m.166794 type:complete len:226 (+) Transcript_67515:1720-2397(+)
MGHPQLQLRPDDKDRRHRARHRLGPHLRLAHGPRHHLGEAQRAARAPRAHHVLPRLRAPRAARGGRRGARRVRALLARQPHGHDRERPHRAAVERVHGAALQELRQYNGRQHHGHVLRRPRAQARARGGDGGSLRLQLSQRRADEALGAAHRRRVRGRVLPLLQVHHLGIVGWASAGAPRHAARQGESPTADRRAQLRRHVHDLLGPPLPHRDGVHVGGGAALGL